MSDRTYYGEVDDPLKDRLSDEIWEKIGMAEDRFADTFLNSSRQPLPLSEVDMAEETNWNVFSETVDILSDLELTSKYSPDLPVLMQDDWHPVFVYGTLKEGFHNHRYLGRDAKFGGYGTSNDFFKMRLYSGEVTKFPVVEFCPSGEQKGRIFGEIWYVRPAMMSVLDQLESNGSMYLRRKQDFEVIVDELGAPKKIRAWMYIGRVDYWTKIGKLENMKKFFPNGDPRQLNGYYCFTQWNAGYINR